MKRFKTLLAAAMIALNFTAVSCVVEETLGPAELSLDQTTLTFELDDFPSQDVYFTATRDWWVVTATLPEWIALDKEEGEATTQKQKVNISVEDNDGFDRSGIVTFTIGFSKVVLTVNQKGAKGEVKKGTGTKEDPFSVAGVIEYVNGLEANVNSTQQFYVKGIVSTITQNYTVNVSNGNTWGNARFNISDDGTAATEFICYNCLYLGNKKFVAGQTDIETGDEVIVCGNVVKFVGTANKPTPEFVSGKNYLYSLNGTTVDVEEEDPTKVEQITCAEFIAKADGNTTYRLKGTVASAVNATYCSFDLNDGTGTVVVWTVTNKDEWKDKVKQGGTVTVRGKYLAYTNKDGSTKHEMVDAYIEAFEEAAQEDPSTVEQITCAEFIAKADPAKTYRLQGLVASAVNATYCSFDLNDGTGTVVVWRVNNKDEWKDKIKQYGTVTVRGKYTLYNNTTVEMVDAHIEDFVEGQAPVNDPKGDGTLANPFNAAGAIKYVKDNGDKETAEDVYVAGKIASITHTYSADPGTAQFVISDDGKLTSLQFTAYSVLYLENQKWEEGKPQIALGDDVVLCGKITVYQGTYETSSQKAYLYSLNGVTSAGPSFKVAETAISVSAKATSATIKVTGNSAWTASCTEAPTGVAATLAPESGTGAGDIVLSFPANEDTENAKVFKVVVSTEAEVATKSYTVTITQKAKTAGGDPVEVIVDFSTMNYENGTQYKTTTVDNVTVTFGDGDNDGKYYTTGTGMRVYSNSTSNGWCQVASEKTITKIVYKFASASYAPATDKFSCDPSGYTVGTYTWEGESNTVKLTNTGGSGHWRLQKLTVTVE